MSQKLAIAVICFVVAGLCLAGLCRAAEFTVDERSAYHFAASGAIAVAADEIMYQTDQGCWTSWQRIGISTAVAQIPGAFKEFVHDGHPDYGDLTFNLLGGLSMAWLNEKRHGWQVAAVVDDDTTMLVLVGEFGR